MYSYSPVENLPGTIHAKLLLQCHGTVMTTEHVYYHQKWTGESTILNLQHTQLPALCPVL